jgi:hypothetical protein
MATSMPAKQSAGQSLALTLVICGLASFAISFIWPNQATSRANWSTEDAKAYQSASVKLHALSHESVHAAGTKNEKAIREKLDQAEAEYNALRGELDSAIERPKQIRIALRVAGLLSVAGGAAIFYKRANAV